MAISASFEGINCDVSPAGIMLLLSLENYKEKVGKYIINCFGLKLREQVQKRNLTKSRLIVHKPPKHHNDCT